MNKLIQYVLDHPDRYILFERHAILDINSVKIIVRDLPTGKSAIVYTHPNLFDESYVIKEINRKFDED